MRKSRVNDLRKSKRNGKNHTRLSRKIRGGVRKENPFLNFARKNRELVREQNPDIGPQDIGRVSRILTDQWKAMSQEEKELYDVELQKKLMAERDTEAQKLALNELKEAIETLKLVPMESNISFVGEKFRTVEKEFNKRNNIDEKSKDEKIL